MLKSPLVVLRIRHQLFYAGLLFAMAAVYSALAPISLGRALWAGMHSRRDARRAHK